MNVDPKKITSEELVKILRNPHAGILEISEEVATIVLNDYIIEDTHIILYEGIEIHKPVKFKNCEFKSDNFIYIDGVVWHEDVMFDSCTMSEGIHLSGTTFKKELCFKFVFTKSIYIHRGFFEKISISGYDIEDITLSNATFKEFNIGEYLLNQTIGEFVVFSDSNEVGNITVTQQNFGKIYLRGTNKDKKFDFENIKCNDINLDNFTNEGSLNFYGIEPIDLTNDQRYFQIVNSNLEKAQFFRADFANYKEFIIIDSFITDCLFIACKWTNNIRAIRGIGYGTFEKSLKDGRKISTSETFAIKEAYRQLKISMSKHSDKIQENIFYGEELNFHNKTMSWTLPWKNQFWDKLILYGSNIFSNYGQSFVKSLFWLIFGHLILFNIAVLLNGFQSLHINFQNPTSTGFEDAFEKYFIYINPLRKPDTSFSGYLIFLDLLMRIWSSYMIYNLIRTSRRYIS